MDYSWSAHVADYTFLRHTGSPDDPKPKPGYVSVAYCVDRHDPRLVDLLYVKPAKEHAFDFPRVALRLSREGGIYFAQGSGELITLAIKDVPADVASFLLRIYHRDLRDGLKMNPERIAELKKWCDLCGSYGDVTVRIGIDDLTDLLHDWEQANQTQSNPPQETPCE